MIKPASIKLSASDTGGQRRVTLERVSLDATVGDVMDEVIPRMNFNRLGPDGKAMMVQARLDRLGGKTLHRSQLVRDVFQHEDEVVLHPRVMAGRGPVAMTH